MKHLYCGPDQEGYTDFLIQPAGKIDRNLIASEKANIDHIAATLGLKEMSQSVLVRKICTLSGHRDRLRVVADFDESGSSCHGINSLKISLPAATAGKQRKNSTALTVRCACFFVLLSRQR